MYIKDIGPQFSEWAFGKEDHSAMAYHELIKVWNNRHDDVVVFPTTWNLENEQCFLRTIYGLHKRFMNFKLKRINDMFGE